MRALSRVVLVLGSFVFPSTLAAETVVTTYVVKVQEERERTRWTLTEWLRIKERMRLMDVWLAMMSDPKKDRFRPELNLVMGRMQGRLAVTGEGGVETATVSGAQGRAQLWLTNLFTGTVGVRALNVDLGFEGFQRASGGFEPTAPAGDETALVAVDGAVAARAMQHSYATVNLRLFGKSIQDSSLVVKYGQYRSKNSVPAWTEAAGEGSFTGVLAGAEAQLYLLRSLGLEGNYLAYGDRTGANGSAAVRGRYHDALGFVEVSLVRLMAGTYQETWSFANGGEEAATVERGVLAGAKLQF